MPELTSDDIAAEVEDQQSADSSSESETSETETADAATTEQPVSETESAEQGSLPTARHKAILESERRKREELEGRFAWAKDLDPHTVDEAFRIADFVRTNPKAAYEQLSKRVASQEPPAPNLRTEDGQLLYSAEQAQRLVDYHVDQLREEFASRLSPIERRAEQETRASLVTEQLSEAMSWPHFDEHLDEITAVIEKAQKQGRPVSLERAYLNVVVPKLTQLGRKQVVTDIKIKAGASDKIRPGRQPARSATKDAERPLGEILEEELAARR